MAKDVEVASLFQPCRCRVTECLGSHRGPVAGAVIEAGNCMGYFSCQREGKIFTSMQYALIFSMTHSLSWRLWGTPLWVSRQVLREYLAAMTRPGDLTGTIPLPALLNDVRYFAQRFRVADEGAPVTAQLLALLTEIPVAGRQVHDANIVATMLVYGVRRLLTHNTDDFVRFAAFIEVLPLVSPPMSEPPPSV